MSEKPMIGGVVVDAPLWRKATEAELLGIVNHLSSASHHYADDSGKEWGAAMARSAAAASEVNRLGLLSAAIRRLHAHAPQLISLEDFTDAILADARSKA